MNGALPPNSSDSFLTVPAHCSISNLPTSVEPVKVNLRTIGFEVSSAPISAAGPVMVGRSNAFPRGILRKAAPNL
jgi:hypothetical protein